MLFSLFSHCLINGEMSCDIFQRILDKIDLFEEEIVCNENILSEDYFDPFTEWLLIATVKYIANNDEATLAKSHRNMQSITPKDSGGFGSAKVHTLAATAFIEVLHPVKYATFLVEQGLHNLMSSDMFAFQKFFDESERQTMQPITLNVLVDSSHHLHKTVLSPGRGACIKGQNKLPE